MHDDELAFAACFDVHRHWERHYQQKLMEWFDPSNPDTWQYGWWHMFEFYGYAIRSYAFAARSGRLTQAQLDPDFLAKCEAEILQAGEDNLALVATKRLWHELSRGDQTLLHRRILLFG